MLSDTIQKSFLVINKMNKTWELFWKSNSIYEPYRSNGAQPASDKLGYHLYSGGQDIPHDNEY